MRKAKAYAPGYEKHHWWLWNDCKAEARQIIRNAKKRLKADQQKTAYRTESPSDQAAKEYYRQRYSGDGSEVNGFFNLYRKGNGICSCIGAYCSC